MLYLLWANEHGHCEVAFKEKAVNLGGVLVMKVPCTLKFTGKKKFFDVLQKTLKH